jgi:hypothetical protein
MGEADKLKRSPCDTLLRLDKPEPAFDARVVRPGRIPFCDQRSSVR